MFAWPSLLILPSLLDDLAGGIVLCILSAGALSREDWYPIHARNDQV